MLCGGVDEATNRRAVPPWVDRVGEVSDCVDGVAAMQWKFLVELGKLHWFRDKPNVRYFQVTPNLYVPLLIKWISLIDDY